MSLRGDLQAIADRPLDGSQRHLLASALVLLTLAAAGALLLGRADRDPSDRDRTAVEAPAPVASSTPAGRRTVEPAPSEEGTLDRQSTPRTADVAAARRAARQALRDYLAYSYGRRPARKVRGVSATLRAQLERDTPRVLARDVRERRPKLLAVTTEGVNPDAAEVLALVDDGQGRYSVRAELTRDADRGWLLTRLDRD